MSLLSVGTNAKTKKSDALGEYVTAIMYLAPSTVSGNNTCKYAGECAKTCLFYAGMGAFSNVQAARIAKTRFFFRDKRGFIAQLIREISSLKKKYALIGLKLAVRLNGTSDIPWEKVAPELFAIFPDVKFYDYTKYPLSERQNLPANYSLTYSHSERSGEESAKALSMGHNVAAVFNGKALPKTWLGHPVINGDAHDLRFQDSRGVIVGLLAKGSLKKAQSNFLVA